MTTLLRLTLLKNTLPNEEIRSREDLFRECHWFPMLMSHGHSKRVKYRKPKSWATTLVRWLPSLRQYTTSSPIHECFWDKCRRGEALAGNELNYRRLHKEKHLILILHVSYYCCQNPLMGVIRRADWKL